MIQYGVIGTPRGFESLTGGDSAGVALESIIDLKNSIVMVFPSTDILRILRDSNRIYYVFYRYAREIASSRPGGFYGSVIMLEGSNADSSVILNALSDLADAARVQFLDDDSRFSRHIKDLKEFQVPDSVLALGESLTHIQFPKIDKFREAGFLSVGAHAEFARYEDVLRRYLADEILPEIQNLYLSTSHEVYEYIKEKKGLPVLNYAQLHADRILEIELQKEKELKEKQERAERERQDRIKAELLEQEQREREKQDAELRRQREAETQKRLQAPFAESRRTVTNAELRQDILTIKNRLDDIERKVFPNRHPQQEGSRPNKKSRFVAFLTEIVYRTRWWEAAIALLLLALVVIVTYMLWQYLDSEGSSAENDTMVTRRNNSALSAVSEKPRISEQSTRIQLNYIGSRAEITTVRELAENIRGSCPDMCSATVNEVVKSLVQINRSIGRRLRPNILEGNGDDVLNFELKNIKGTITFEVPRCCDLSKIKPDSFEENKK